MKTMNILKSSVKPADSMTQAFRVVLHPAAHNGEFVTHCENVVETPCVPLGYASLNSTTGQTTIRTETGNYQSKQPSPDYYHGNYFRDDYCAAVADYEARCEKYGLKP